MTSPARRSCGSSMSAKTASKQKTTTLGAVCFVMYIYSGNQTDPIICFPFRTPRFLSYVACFMNIAFRSLLSQRKPIDPCDALYLLLRGKAEAALLEMGVQEGTVSHHKKNWAIVYRDGLEKAILLDCGQVCVSKVAAQKALTHHMSLLRYQNA